MKQILYFLIGFIIVIFPLKYLYADECSTTSCITSYYSTAYPTASINNLGTYATSALADAAVKSASALPSSGAGSYLTVSSCSSGDPAYYRWAQKGTDPNRQVFIAFYEYINVNLTISYCTPNLDQDSDGIPDECDIYPDDPTPYKIRTVSYPYNVIYTNLILVFV
jgi:hypothetical protein